MTNVICGNRAMYCECVKPVDHDGPHECDEGCGGGWEYDPDGRFVIVAWPIGVRAAGRPQNEYMEPAP